MAVLQQIKVPLISVNDTALTVLEKPFETGDAIKQGDVILVFETSKTAYDVEAEAGGFIEYTCRVGNEYEVDTTVARIVSTVEEIREAVEAASPVPQSARQNNNQAANWQGQTLFSKSAWALVQENGIDKEAFSGRDFVNNEDVLVYLGKDLEKDHLPRTASQKAIKVLNLPVAENTIVKKLTSHKKREIEYLLSVQSAGLTSTVNTFIETDGIFVHLDDAGTIFKNSLLPVTIFETSRLLNKYQQLNAFYHDDAIHYYGEIGVGFAIDIDRGLKVIKIPDAQLKSFSQVEEDMVNLSGKYLDDTLHYDDLAGVTFTITDLSSENVAFFRPLVNFMNSAILGISAIDEKLGRCILTVTFDHRVTEGKLVARFLKELKDRLESYRSAHFTRQVAVACFKCYKSLADDLSDVGFAKCITPKGEEAYICQSCLKGF